MGAWCRGWAVLALALAAARASAQSCPAVGLDPVLTSGLSSPLYVAHAGDDSDRLFIVERGGTIKVLPPGATSPTVFLTIPTSKILSGGEQGLLGLAFHPDYESNRRFFVYYTNKPNGDSVVAEYHASASDPNVADPTATTATETELFTFTQPFANHNGGSMAFGSDGYLYIASGDGGDANDPGNRAQSVTTLLGKILRIDVDTPNGAIPYSSPSDNPYFGPTAGMDEIYAIGMRNPWRMGFDRSTGALLAGDVGQGQREEVDIIQLGGNYGWRVMEGTRCNIGGDTLPCDSPAFTPPAFEYTHSAGRCSITGGYVYRGPSGVLADGTYLFGDFCTGEIFSVDVDTLPVATLPATPPLLLDTSLLLASFGEDEAGEHYAVGLGGQLYRLVHGVHTSPSSAAFDADGGDGSLSVISPAGCPAWTAVSNDAWIVVTSGASGTGNGTVEYSVASNPVAFPRTGTMTIAGRTFSVTQTANPTPGLSIDDVSVSEGASGTTPAAFVVSLSGPSSQTVTVQYATADQGATSPADYTAKALTTLTFLPGETSQPVTVNVKGDTKDETDETFVVNLSNAVNASLDDTQGEATILDDDPEPSLGIADKTVVEGSGNKNVSLTVTLSPASGKTVTVDYATGPGTATAGSEYTPKSGSLTFTPGQTNKSLSLTTKGDLIDEPNENFVVNLTNPQNAGISDNQATVTIQDDDEPSPPAVASIGDPSAVTEGDSGTQSIVLTVTLSAASTQTVSVGFTTAPGSAASSQDYNNKSGTLTFSPGQTSKTLSVAVKGDIADEDTESFFVNLQNPAGVTIGDGQAEVTILDNESPPSVSIADAAVTEGNSGTKNVTFTVSLSAPSGFTVSVDYDTQDDTATAADDYTASSGSVTFTPGQTSRTFMVQVAGDTIAEPTESFDVLLSNPVQANPGDMSAAATITDNDGV